eukprot:860701-Rhodomonas_salina.1
MNKRGRDGKESGAAKSGRPRFDCPNCGKKGAVHKPADCFSLESNAHRRPAGWVAKVPATEGAYVAIEEDSVSHTEFGMQNLFFACVASINEDGEQAGMNFRGSKIDNSALEIQHCCVQELSMETLDLRSELGAAVTVGSGANAVSDIATSNHY